MSELRETIKNLIEVIREGDFPGSEEIDLPGEGKEWGGVTISLARFQSYRARTEAALIEELEDVLIDAKRVYVSVVDVYVYLDVE